MGRDLPLYLSMQKGLCCVLEARRRVESVRNANRRALHETDNGGRRERGRRYQDAARATIEKIGPAIAAVPSPDAKWEMAAEE